MLHTVLGKNGSRSSIPVPAAMLRHCHLNILLRASRVEAFTAAAAAAACRAVQPALVPEDAAMPRLDFVVLSHNHYDHLDAGSVDRLHR
jgi:L-ascorbate metabolism protein UlaG (beta-lactamase superfamily)